MRDKIEAKPGLNRHRYPFSADLIDGLAETICQQHPASLCDLNRITIFLDNPNSIQYCRKRILQYVTASGCEAMLGPAITTLPLWSGQYPIKPGCQLIDQRQRELILVEALLEHRQLYQHASPWSLADNLLSLFDDLVTHTDPLSKDLNRFAADLCTAYGIDTSDNRYLMYEANLVHQLWHAMQQQLQAFNYLDQNTAYRHQLSAALTLQDRNRIFYFAGLLHPNPVETGFIKVLAQTHEVHLITFSDSDDFYSAAKLYSAADNTPGGMTDDWLRTLNIQNVTDRQPQTNGDSSRIAAFFDLIYHPHEQSMASRRDTCLQHNRSSPISGKIAVFKADDRETEALAIQIQIRLWLESGKQNIGFVTNNRKLARRVRALLERHAVELLDESGWNLSTTRSAAILEHWLQCIESNFHYLSLLELLKSPFIFPDEDRQQRLITVYRFERHIVLQENIRDDLYRYIDEIKRRKARLPVHLRAYLDDIIPLLQRIHAAATPLLQACGDQETVHAPAELLDLLLQSMQNIGMLAAFNSDAAGEQIITELECLRKASQAVTLKIRWPEWRAWLGHKLEQRQFRAASRDTRVQVVNLRQSNLKGFDAVVLGAAEREFLPGNSAASPFFNNAARTELGLPGDELRKNAEFTLFRHLLEQAALRTDTEPGQPALLITHTRLVEDEEIQPSAWLELLVSNHEYYYHTNLDAVYLRHYLQPPLTKSGTAGADNTDEDYRACARTAVAEHLLPRYFSASSYQQLVDCPYQFFAARCLQLKPPEQIREYLQKSDYGELVHRVLEAFHSDLPGYPGPFPEKRCHTTNRQQAIDLLTDISDQVFHQNIEDNFAHRAWLNQWLSIVPAYVDWLIQRQNDWQVAAVETRLDNVQLDEITLLKARLDRIDKNQQGLSILDYKTGIVGKQASVLNGEAVQLPFYALAKTSTPGNDTADKVVQIAYLSLANDGVRMKNTISDDDLENLRARTGERLQKLNHQIHSGSALSAWGDETVCAYCSMQGICRRQYRDNIDIGNLE